MTFAFENYYRHVRRKGKLCSVVFVLFLYLRTRGKNVAVLFLLISTLKPLHMLNIPEYNMN